MIEKEFIPYEQALALKELGFDEPCFAHLKPNVLTYEITIGEFNEFEYHSAPTFSQAFRWFREKYLLIGEIFTQLRPSHKFMFGFKIAGSDSIIDGFETYEEAELACLRKLIKMANEKQ